MNSLKYGASFAAVALLLCATAFSKDKNSGSFDLPEPAKVGSTVLQPGHYKVEWTGTEKDVKVSILQRGKTVATANGSIEQLPSKALADAVSLKTQQDNTKSVDEIEFDNRSEALVLSGM
jgi:hypothetical protein